MKEVKTVSVVIIGGNECMTRQYIELCSEYNCKAKVFTQPSGDLRSQIGKPDLMVLFTNTVSHKMVRCALNEVKSKHTKVARSHSSSISSLKNILEANTI